MLELLSRPVSIPERACAPPSDPVLGRSLLTTHIPVQYTEIRDILLVTPELRTDILLKKPPLTLTF